MFEQIRIVDKSCSTNRLVGILFCGADENLREADSVKLRIAWRPVSNREESAVRLFQIGALCGSTPSQPAGDRAGEITGAGYTYSPPEDG